jgi:uroporphyrinogen decarboxylase
MNSRERVLAAVRREKPDKIPRALSWGLSPAAYELFKAKTGETDPYDYFDVDVRFLHPLPGRKLRDYSSYQRPETPVNEWGVGHVPSSDTSLHFTKIISPLRHAGRVEEITEYPLPDLDAPYRYETYPQQVTDLNERGLAAAGVAAMTIFEVAWQIRGFEEIMIDMMINPEMANCLFERITLLRIPQVQANVKAGCDLLMLGDDVSGQNGMLMKPELWRRFLKPRLGRIIDTAKAINPIIPIFYHSDGDCRAIIEDLIEIGVTILNPIQPECMNPAEIKIRYGDRLAFWGTVGTQTTLPFGTPEDVRQEIRLRMETVGYDGGLVLGPTHTIEPEVPWENIEALYKAIDDYGLYR